MQGAAACNRSIASPTAPAAVRCGDARQQTTRHQLASSALSVQWRRRSAGPANPFPMKASAVVTSSASWCPKRAMLRWPSRAAIHLCQPQNTEASAASIHGTAEKKIQRECGISAYCAMPPNRTHANIDANGPRQNSGAPSRDVSMTSPLAFARPSVSSLRRASVAPRLAHSLCSAEADAKAGRARRSTTSASAEYASSPGAASGGGAGGIGGGGGPSEREVLALAPNGGRGGGGGGGGGPGRPSSHVYECDD